MDWNTLTGFMFGNCSSASACCCKGSVEGLEFPPTIQVYEAADQLSTIEGAPNAAQATVTMPLSDSPTSIIPPHHGGNILTSTLQGSNAVSPRHDVDSLDAFVFSMKQGLDVHLVLDDGALLEVTTYLNPTCTEIMLQLNRVTRSILLSEIEHIGAEGADETSGLRFEHLQGRCTTLVLSSTHFLTFAFSNAESRIDFERCFRALIATNRSRNADDSRNFAQDSLIVEAGCSLPEVSTGRLPHRSLGGA